MRGLFVFIGFGTMFFDSGVGLFLVFDIGVIEGLVSGLFLFCWGCCVRKEE